MMRRTTQISSEEVRVQRRGVKMPRGSLVMSHSFYSFHRRLTIEDGVLIVGGCARAVDPRYAITSRLDQNKRPNYP